MDPDRDALRQAHPGEDRVDGRDAPIVGLRVRDVDGPRDAGDPAAQELGAAHQLDRGGVTRADRAELGLFEVGVDPVRVGVHELQYDAGLRLEWTLFDGFERRNKVRLAESTRKEAEGELDHTKDKAVREVWKAYNDAKVALEKQKAAAALLSASEESWKATFESYRNGLATFPDVREAQRSLASARTLDQATRAEALTRSAAFAFSTGDLAKP